MGLASRFRTDCRGRKFPSVTQAKQSEKKGKAMITKRLLFAALLIASAVGRFAGELRADEVTIEWTGFVYSSDVSGIAPGDKISGSFTYDDNAPVAYGNATSKVYDTQHISSFSVNGISGSRNDGQIRVADYADPQHDQFSSQNTSQGAYVGDKLGGYEVYQIFVRFNGVGALSGLDLPSADNPLDPADWKGNGFSRLDLTNAYNQGPHIEFVVGSFTFTTASVDSDEDGLTDAEEALYGTDPADADTDDDGLLDGTEVVMADGTGLPDPLDPDSDDDGLLDGEEVMLGTDPANPDTDGDGVEDSRDPTPTDPGVSSGFIEEALRELAFDLDSLSVEYFSGKNDNAAAGRRNSMSNRAGAAANAVNSGDVDNAIDQLLSLLDKVDGEKSPPDWMFESVEKEMVAGETELLIELLLMM